MGSPVNFYQTLKEEFLPNLYNLFQRIEAEKVLHPSFCVTSIVLVPKLVKDITRKEKCRIISLS